MAGIFEAYGHLLGAPFVFAVPSPTLLVRVLLMFVLPVLAGNALRRLAPGFAEVHAKSVQGRASPASPSYWCTSW
jgi:hypothetical protein